MKKHNYRNTRGLALFLILILVCTGPGLPASAAPDNDTFYLNTAADLIDLAEYCRLDAWSQDKTVVLTADISLSNVEFSPIPTFGGTFDGGGHTISGLTLSGSISPIGLFGTIQPGGIVRDLNVTGNILPDGSKDNAGGIAGENNGIIKNCSFTGTVSGGNSVGGIAGINGQTGTIRNCTAGGSVTGKSMTGGIAGRNLGTISICENRVYVNIAGADPSLDINELNFGASNDLYDIHALDTVNIATDTGGIAGYSSGTIKSCTNLAVIGYQHIGYNVGGIAGRSSGHITGCVNRGEVFGRKDIGGIAGQAEPYITLNLTMDQLENIRQELNRLNTLIDNAAADADSLGSDLSGQLTGISGTVDSAINHVDTLSNLYSDYGSNAIDEINRASSILSDTVGRLSQITENTVGLSEVLSRGFDLLHTATLQLADTEQFSSQAAQDLRLAADDFSRAGDLMQAGLRKINDGIKKLADIENQDQTDEGLSDITDGLSDLSSAAAADSDAFSRLSGAFETSGMSEASAAAGELSDSMNEMCGALQTINDGAETIRENPDTDSDRFQDGLNEIQAGLDIIIQMSDPMDEASRHLQDALKDTEELSDGLGDAFGTVSDAMDIFRDGSKNGTDILASTADLFRYLNSVESIQIAHPGMEIDNASDALLDSMKQLSQQMETLNLMIDSTSGTLTDDLRAVNTQLNQTMNTIFDAVYGIESGSGQDLLSDTSLEDINAVTSGKILSCINYAGVAGDINTGGIAGSMAVEYALDPEDDLSSDVPLYRREYELKAILQKCINYGSVTGRRDYTGGICGLSDLGLIICCEGYGTISSESGDYVGGITGFSGGTIQDCFAKCWLSGGDYIGGITGAAASSDDSGGTVSRCYSFVQITDYDQYAGAVSGSVQGAFQDNYFVSDDLAGLDRVSLSGQAEAMNYSSLLQVEGLPSEFKHLTLRFLAQDRILKKVTFDYGGSFSEDIFPDIPPLNGSFGTWDIQDLTSLTFDTDVTAVYTQYISTLACDAKRDDGRYVFLAEGLFRDEDIFTAVKTNVPKNEASELFSSTFFSRRKLTETWQLDGLDSNTHIIRYLSPTGDSDGLELYARNQNGWVKLDTENAGSYLLITVSGPTLEIAVVSQSANWPVLIAVFALAAALISCLTFGIVKHHRRRKAAECAADTAQDGTAQNENDAPQDSAAQNDAVRNDTAQDVSAAPLKIRKKRRKGLIITLGILAAGIAAGILIFLFSGLKDSLDVYFLLKKYDGKENLTTHLTLETQIDNQHHHMETLITRSQSEGKRVICAEQYGASFYYCEGLVYLENGQSFEMNGLFPDYPNLLSDVIALYKGSDISVFKNQGERIYSVTVDGDTALSILENLLPSAAGDLSHANPMEIVLVKRGGELAELRFHADGLCSDDENTPIAITAVLTVTDKNSSDVELPQRIREQISGAKKTEPVTDDAVFRLLESWIDLNAREPLTADVSLAADCGPLVLNDELVWNRIHANGLEVNSIRKNDHTYYFSNGNVYNSSGNRDNTAEPELSSPEHLLSLAYQLCVNGEIECTENDGIYTYLLTLDENGMAQAAHTILPDMENLSATLGSGSIQITITDKGIENIRFSCFGSVKVIVADVPVSLSAELHFRESVPDESLTVPDDVIDSLSKAAP